MCRSISSPSPWRASSTRPVVLSSQRAHRALTPGVTRQLLRLTDRIVDGIVVNSRAVARELAEDDVPASMLRLAYNGVDTDPSAAMARAEFRLDRCHGW